MSVNPDRFNWNDLPEEQVGESCSRQMIHTPHLTILRLKFKKGAVLPLHNHVHEQVTMVAAGSIRLEVNGQEFILGPGDVLRIPSDVPHRLEALEDSVATDVFTPARDDLKSPPGS